MFVAWITPPTGAVGFGVPAGLGTFADRAFRVRVPLAKGPSSVRGRGSRSRPRQSIGPGPSSSATAALAFWFWLLLGETGDDAVTEAGLEAQAGVAVLRATKINRVNVNHKRRGFLDNTICSGDECSFLPTAAETSNHGVSLSVQSDRWLSKSRVDDGFVGRVSDDRSDSAGGLSARGRGGCL